jgi:hypothetical protein
MKRSCDWFELLMRIWNSRPEFLWRMPHSPHIQRIVHIRKFSSHRITVFLFYFIFLESFIFFFLLKGELV